MSKSIGAVNGVQAVKAAWLTWARVACMAVAGVVLAGCAAPAARKPPPDTTCKPAAANDSLVGNWLSVRKQTGVAGELYTLFTLKADGTMAYAERLKRGRQPSQGLSETGCWERDGQGIKLRTLASNGVPVDLHDPIYVNRYQIKAHSASALDLGYQGTTLKARKMPADYRMPL